MPRLIPTDTEESIELGDLVERLETGGFDGEDEENFASWGEGLRKLANNRDFLPRLMIAELKERCRRQLRDNQFSAQVILLHGAPGRFLVRANIWPALKDSVVRHSGTDPFFYGIPHDHNFSFLTVGYFGPGYWSDYYEYDYGGVVGYPGEKVELRFVERSRLEPGKVMLYRAHKDIHLQLPADEMSVSINIVETAHSTLFKDQYRFDVQGGTVAGILTRTSIEPMLALAAHQGGEEGADLIAEFAARHPSDRIRWSALRARAAAASTLDGRIAVFEEATRNGSGLVATMARREIAGLEAMRGWIETVPPVGAHPAA
ncbi:transposase [Sphingosinicella sp. CPCC 101087]|uniref:transposase n=1 Tax=Sphingosinicella sp. CPCC 101087 TaxID=2497754 RepID=UPI00101C9FE0|nr:transposase [Sphingosinicella sp. CPCC 101087]